MNARLYCTHDTYGSDYNSYYKYTQKRTKNKNKGKRVKRLVMSLLVASATYAGTFSTIGIEQFKKLQATGVPVMDIRTPYEWKDTGIIKGSHKIMFFNERGEALSKKWFEALGKIYKDNTKPIILYCAHANRSKSLGKWLASDKVGFNKVYELKGGIMYGWIDKGQPIVK